MYATFALTMAREAGFEVPEIRMRKALGYLRRNLFERGEDKFHGAQWTRELAVFNLAMGKQLSAQELESFFADYDELSSWSKALLLLAAKKIGYLPDNELVSRVLKLDPVLDPKRIAYYNSSFRGIAACLLAAMDLRADPKKAEKWVGMLLRGLKPEGCWVSTADTGWCLLALAKYYEVKEIKAPKNIKVTIDYGGADPTELTLTETTAYLELDRFKLLEKGGINIKSDSKHLISYTLDLIYPDLVTDPGQLSKGFTLRKRIDNLNAKEEIRVGDVVRVTLEMDLRDPNQYYSGKDFEYLALVDPVPAGLVPINSDLKTEGVQEGTTGTRGRFVGGYCEFTPTYQEFRDDGVRVFKNLAWDGSYRYSYVARAVAEGDFWMRGSRISLMYDPEYFGRTQGKRIEILPAK
ncbi:MAG: hypothetical protein FJY85_14840 [Deltaproteobacteria bacterium]|nr:hypothetical protein [Deltaproteobacteria bacterium]